MLNRGIYHVYELVIHQNHPYPQLFPNPDKNEKITFYVRNKEQAKYFRDHLFRGCKMTIKPYIGSNEGDKSTLLDWSHGDQPQRMEMMDWKKYYGSDRLSSMPETSNYCFQYGGDLINSRAGNEYRITQRLLKALLDAPNNTLVYYNARTIGNFGDSRWLHHIDLCTDPLKYTSIIYKDGKGRYSLAFPKKQVSLVPEVECRPGLKK